MSKGSNTTTTQTGPNPIAAQDYYALLNQAQGVAATPYTPYTGQLTAPVNQQQQTGIGTVNQYATGAEPYLQTAAGYAENAAQPLTGAQIQQYESPYTQQVVGATQAEFNNQNAQTNQGILGNAAAQGALGGDRVGVAQGIAAGQEQLAQAPVIAGLENQGYAQAVQTAEQQQQNQAAGAYNLSNVGNAIENAGLTGANAQVGAGTLEQQTQQAQDLAAYQQFEQMLQYPFATTGWEAGLETGVGSQLGGTSSTTGPAPNQLAQLLGAGIGAGAAVLSDKRSKENIRRIGRLNDGQTIYRFNYKGDKATRIGLMAQDVEKINPDAVHEVNGMKAVDYDEATKDAIRRLRGGRVQGLAAGGTPYGGDATMPYSTGLGWVPSLSITGGSGAPKPPNAPNQQQQSGVQSPMQMMQNASKIASAPGLGSAFNTGSTELASGMNASDLSALTGEDAATSDLALAALPFGEKRGGRVLAFKRGGVPVRAGMGMASFLPRARRQGLDTGGVPDDDSVTFSDRFAGLAPQAAPSWSAALSPMSATAAAYGQENPYASAPVPLPANQNVPGPTAGVGNAVSYGTPPQGNFSPVATPQTAPDAGVAAPLQVAPTAAASPPAGVSAASQPEPMDVYQNTIKKMETGDQKNPYSAMVPSVDPKTGATRYAIGAYGIMDSNVPTWTKEALGKPMTPQEFAADPSAQDAVFRAKFGNYVQKYGPEGAARAWLAGEGGMNNPNAKDTFGTDPLSYGRKFANSIVGAGMNTGNNNAQLPANSTPTTNPDARQIPGIAEAQPQQRGFGLMGLLSNDVGMSAMSAGLGMLASRSPFLGEAIGQGGLQGLGTYSSLQQQHVAQSEKQQDLDIKVAQLNQQAKAESDRIAQEARPYSEMTASQKVEAAQKAQETAQKAQQQQFEQNKGVNLPPGGTLVNPSTGKVIATSDSGLMSDQAVNLIVDRIHAGDPSALQNLGRGAQTGINLTRVQNRLAERAEAEGWSGADLAAAKANFTSQSAAATTAARRESNVESSVEEAKNTFPLVLQASAALPRSSFVPLNKLEQMIQAGTSDPRYIKYNTSLQGAMTAYAQAMSRTGTNSVYAQEAAHSLLEKATGPEGIAAALDQMGQEMEAAKVAPELVRQHILGRISGRGAAAPTTMPQVGQSPGATGAAPAMAATKPAAMQSNGWVYKLQPDGSYNDPSPQKG